MHLLHLFTAQLNTRRRLFIVLLTVHSSISKENKKKSDSNGTFEGGLSWCKKNRKDRLVIKKPISKASHRSVQTQNPQAYSNLFNYKYIRRFDMMRTVAKFIVPEWGI
jgi:hypothetical protein